jgi:hypothetical protein
MPTEHQPSNPEQTPATDTSPLPPQAKTSRLAVVSFILCLLTLPLAFIGGVIFVPFIEELALPGMVVGWLIGPILSIVALRKISRSKRLLRGKPWAIAGLVAWGINVYIIFFQIEPYLRDESHCNYCGSGLKGLGAAIKMYQNDFNGQYPPNLNILIETEDVSPKNIACRRTGEPHIYRGVDLPNDAPGEMILVYDQAGNHKKLGRNVLFADFDVRRTLEEDMPALIERDNALRRELGLVEKPLE